jgi:hypothetical protein
MTHVSPDHVQPSWYCGQLSQVRPGIHADCHSNLALFGKNKRNLDSPSLIERSNMHSGCLTHACAGHDRGKLAAASKHLSCACMTKCGMHKDRLQPFSQRCAAITDQQPCHMPRQSRGTQATAQGGMIVTWMPQNVGSDQPTRLLLPQGVLSTCKTCTT